MSSMDRREILELHGLLYAPAARQQAFWAGYNYRGRRRKATALGEMAAQMASSSILQPYDGWGALMAAWSEVVPAGCHESARPQSLSNGRLRVAVSDAGTMYSLSRRHGKALVAALNERLGRGEIRRLDLKLMGAGRRAAGAGSEVKETDASESKKSRGGRAKVKSIRKDRA